MVSADPRAALGHQALGRPLTALEQGLARALEAAFAAGQHDLAAVVHKFNQDGLKRPSGAAGPWSLDALQQELAQINASLDEAYATNGAMPL